jgi:uncharacterized protein (TIGR03067 family)
MRPYALILLAAIALIAGDRPKDSEGKSDAENLQGTWKLVSLEADGAKAPEEQIFGMRLIISGERFVVADNHTTTHGTLKVDTSKKPKTIDLTFTDGPEAGKTSLGIYTVEGDKTTLCLSLAGKDRPKTFKTKSGTDLVLEVLKRVKR